MTNIESTLTREQEEEIEGFLLDLHSIGVGTKITPDYLVLKRVREAFPDIDASVLTQFVNNWIERKAQIAKWERLLEREFILIFPAASVKADLSKNDETLRVEVTHNTGLRVYTMEIGSDDDDRFSFTCFSPLKHSISFDYPEDWLL